MSLKSRSKEILSTKNFKKFHHPIKIGCINDVKNPYVEQKILRMCVSNDGENYYLPEELEWLRDLFEKSLEHQSKYFKIKHVFCYITVRHGLVNTVTDDKWHVDGYSERISHIPEQNYIWVSGDTTEYAKIEVKFPKDFNLMVHNINFHLEKFVTDENIFKIDEKSLYVIDPYILHRRPPNIDKSKPRTFVRISFVPIEIRDKNNTINKELPPISLIDGVSFRNSLVEYIEK